MNQETVDSAIPIFEWMNKHKCKCSDRGSHDRIHFTLAVDSIDHIQPSPHQLRDIFRSGRDKVNMLAKTAHRL